ncbi:MAG: hypothetical protein ACLTMP_09310 [Eggerthella lenta]
MVVLGNVDDRPTRCKRNRSSVARHAAPAAAAVNMVHAHPAARLLTSSWRNRGTPCAMRLFAADVDGSGVWWSCRRADAGGARVCGAIDRQGARHATPSLAIGRSAVLVLFYVNVSLCDHPRS